MSSNPREILCFNTCVILYSLCAFEMYCCTNDDDGDDDGGGDDGDDSGGGDDDDDSGGGQTGAARLRINNQLAADSFQNLIGFICRPS